MALTAAQTSALKSIAGRPMGVLFSQSNCTRTGGPSRSAARRRWNGPRGISLRTVRALEARGLVRLSHKEVTRNHGDRTLVLIFQATPAGLGEVA